jgi:UDPglucose 6-dehydrogenase
MKLFIVGRGFVGAAVDYGFTNNKVVKFIIDPKVGTSISDMKVAPDVAFVCVPTPMNSDGNINSSIVVNAVLELVERFPEALIVVKSTVTPDIIKSLSTIDRFIYNPEFLMEKSANEDFVNPNLHVFGGKYEYTKQLESIYHQYSICKPCPVYHMSAEEASFVKYGINTFLASKVVWFNQFFDIINSHGSNYGTIVNAMTGDPRIGKSHTTVPGFDNRRGAGGACFPKDSFAFSKFADGSFTILNEVIERNNEYRAEYELDAREKEQNVRFDLNL